LKENVKGKFGGLKKFFKKKRNIAISLVVLAGIIFTVSKMGGAKEQDITIPQESFAKVSKGNIEMSISSSGNIESKYLKDLKTKNRGSISNVYMKEGQKVNRGDRILDLDNEDNTISVSQKEISIFREEQSLTDLIEKADKLNLKSPYSGVVTEIKVQEGDEVSNGEEFLTIIDKDTIVVKAPFTKGQISQMSVGNEAKVILTDSFKSVTGKVTELEKNGKGSTTGAVLYNAVIEIKNPGSILEGVFTQPSVKLNSGVFADSYAIEKPKTEFKRSEVVKFEVGGDIKRIVVKEGDKVSIGQVLVNMENDDVMKEITLQRKSLESSRLDYNKQTEKLNDNIIYSPIEGTVVDIPVVSGENVAEEQVVAKVADLNNLEMTVMIDEMDILNVKEGQKAIVEVSAIEGSTYEGTVTSISQLAKVENGMAKYEVTVTLNQVEGIKLGMSASVKVILQSKEDILILPIEAITNEGEKSYVFVKEEGKEENKKVEVQTGINSNSTIEIVSGVKEGEEVLLQNSVPFAMPGMGM
jgi:HlyD family secretion protein